MTDTGSIDFKNNLRGALTLVDILVSNNFGSAKDLAEKCKKIFMMLSEHSQLTLMEESEKLWKKCLKNANASPDEMTSFENTVVNAYCDIADKEQEPRQKADFLQIAIYIAKKYHKPKKAGQLHAELLKVQKSIPSTMHSLSVDIEIKMNLATDCIKKELTACDSFQKALETFVSNLTMPNCDYSSSELRELVQSNPLAFIGSEIYLDEEGKTRKVAPSIDFGDFEKENPRVQKYIYDNFLLDIRMCSALYVEIFLKEILDKFQVDDSILIEFLSESSFVPEARLDLFLYGVKAGFENDFAKAALTLVLQLENSFREFLLAEDIPATPLLADGIQKDKDLNAILKEKQFSDIIRRKIGANNFEVLSRLYINDNGFGCNFRNDIAHGLLSLGSLSGDISKYSWAFILRLIGLFKK